MHTGRKPTSTQTELLSLVLAGKVSLRLDVNGTLAADAPSRDDGRTWAEGDVDRLLCRGWVEYVDGPLNRRTFTRIDVILTVKGASALHPDPTTGVPAQHARALVAA